jgi:hypothetical protein
MVDTKAFRKMHPANPHLLPPAPADEAVEFALDSEVFERDEPPDGDFALLLPHETPGFNMEKKEWSKRCYLKAEGESANQQPSQFVR